MLEERDQSFKLVVNRMREAAELLQVYTAKSAATNATKVASAASMDAAKTAALASELSVLAAKAATIAADAAANAATDALNVARIARATDDAFHRADDAAAAELPDDAIKWSMEAARLSKAAVAAAEAAAKALGSYGGTTNSGTTKRPN